MCSYGRDLISLRLQTIFLLAMGIAFACCMLLGGVSLVASLKDYRSLKAGAAELSVFHAALDAASAVSAERGPANSAMGPDRGDEALRLSELAAKRRETDRTIETLRAAAASHPGKVQVLMAFLDERLAEGRRAVDKVTAMPLGRRSPQEVIGAIEEMFLVADAAAALRDRLGRDIVEKAPQISTEVMLGTAASSMREHAGRLGSFVVMMLSADAAGDARIRPRLQAAEGQLTALRDIVCTYAGAFFPGRQIQDAITDVERSYYGEALPFAMRTAAAHTRTNAITAAGFTQHYVPGLKSSENLRELIIRNSAGKLGRLQEAALRGVMLSAALSLAISLILLAVAIVFKRSLFDPLIVARKQIVAIAEGDLSEPRLAGSISREVDDMFDGLKVLWRHQLRKHELEQEQKRLSKRLRDLAELDPLTSLMNRRAIENSAGRMIRQADRDGTCLAVILVDIDRFKSINDTHGHGIGDLVLRRVAKEFKAVLHSEDPLSRFGGEEFLILLKNTDLAAGAAMAERLRARLHGLTLRQDLSLKITASFGVAVRPASSELTWDELVNIADRRLYRAKHAGRDRVCAEDGREAFSPPAKRA